MRCPDGVLDGVFDGVSDGVFAIVGDWPAKGRYIAEYAGFQDRGPLSGSADARGRGRRLLQKKCYWEKPWFVVPENVAMVASRCFKFWRFGKGQLQTHISRDSGGRRRISGKRGAIGRLKTSSANCGGGVPRSEAEVTSSVNRHRHVGRLQDKYLHPCLQPNCLSTRSSTAWECLQLILSNNG